MPSGSQVRRVARAALNVAAEMGVVDEFLERFGLLDRTFRGNKAFRHLMITHRVPVEEKMKVLRRAFSGILSELEYEILQLLMERNMGIELPSVARALMLIARASDVRLDLTVFTPEPISEQELQKLGKRVEGNIGRSLRVTSSIDPDLLGGIKLRLGNTLVDGSMARRLEMLREELV